MSVNAAEKTLGPAKTSLGSILVKKAEAPRTGTGTTAPQNVMQSR
jgi:hypothetical protein